MTLAVAGELRELRRGEAVCAPKGVPHTYRVDSEQARWLVVTVNGDFEAFVRAAARPAGHDGLPEPSSPPAPEELGALEALAGRYGIRFVGPALEP